MHAEGNKQHIANVDDTVRLDVIKEELANCQALGGYMASASVVKSYLEKRAFQLENKIRLDNIKPHTDDIGAHDG